MCFDCDLYMKPGMDIFYLLHFTYTQTFGTL